MESAIFKAAHSGLSPCAERSDPKASVSASKAPNALRIGKTRGRKRRSASWMVLRMQLGQALAGHMGVDRSGRDVGMAQ